MLVVVVVVVVSVVAFVVVGVLCLSWFGSDIVLLRWIGGG